MKYFIASRWINMKRVQYLTENLTALGHEVFSFVSDNRNFVSSKNLTGTGSMLNTTTDWQNNEEIKKIFDNSIEGLRKSDVVVLLLPAGKASHIEAGIAYGLNKHLILIGEPESTEAHYLVFNEWHKTVEAYLEALKSHDKKSDE